jgi:hypothetical protein
MSPKLQPVKLRRVRGRVGFVPLERARGVGAFLARDLLSQPQLNLAEFDLRPLNAMLWY